jgi:gliding motility-associated-like protein
MENKEFNFEQIKQRLENYEQAPQKDMWQKIEKQIRPNNFLLKTAIALSSLLLVGFVGVLVFTPLQNAETKPLTQEVKSAEKISKKTEIFSKENKNIPKETEIISKEKFVEEKQENIVVSTPIQKEVKIEKQEPKIIEEKQEIAIKNPQKTEIKQKEITPIIEEKIAEQIVEEKTPEVEEITNRLKLFIPNAFIPEAADKNAIFKPAFTELKDYRMDIYSSNGTLVFTSNNIEYGWDGTYKGSPQPQGVYVYVVKFITPKGESSQQKGELMLIR